MASSPLLKITPERVIEIPCSHFSSSTVDLLLQNVSNFPFVAYKIKTTAPKSYLVRPSTGVVARGCSSTVQIVLQAFTEDPPRPSVDRFLVQATPVESSMPLARNYWISLPKTEVEETRLNVLFKTSTSSKSAASALGGASSLTAADLDAPGRGGISAASREAGGGRGGSGCGPAEVKAQYEQLIEYALAMERHKEDLFRENEALKAQLESRGSRSLSEMWHIPVYIFIFVMAWYLLERSFGGGGDGAAASKT